MVFVVCQTKEELLRVLGLQEEEGSSLEFLRRGYKVVPDSAFVCLRTLNPSPFATSLYLSLPIDWGYVHFLPCIYIYIFYDSHYNHINAECHLVGRKC